MECVHSAIWHFLACCLPDALFAETTVETSIAGESFTATGLVVMERGWLHVYPYVTVSDQNLPRFDVGEPLSLAALTMTESSTEPPPLLNEADVVGQMIEKGIGFGPWMYNVIRKLERAGYVTITIEDRLELTSVGVKLIEAYSHAALEGGLDPSKPDFRAQVECRMLDIAFGKRQLKDFVTWYTTRVGACLFSLSAAASHFPLSDPVIFRS